MNFQLPSFFLARARKVNFLLPLSLSLGKVKIEKKMKSSLALISKKIFLLTFLALLFLSLIPPVQTHAGLVPCKPGECELCDLFVMLDNIVDFLLVKLVPPLAVLMLVIGGVMFILGAGSPVWVSRGKSIMFSVIIGLVIIYAAWLILGLFFQAIGVAEWTGYSHWWKEGFFKVPCH